MVQSNCTAETKTNNRVHNALLKVQTEISPKLNALQTLSSEIIKHFSENCEQINRLQSIQTDIIKSFEDVQQEQVQCDKEEFEWQQKLEAMSETERNKSEDLADLYCLLGYAITDFKILSNGVTQITLHHNEDCWLELLQHAGKYKLLQLQPDHPRLEELQLMLQRTQDTQGLLAYLRKFFEYTKNLMTTT